MNKTAIFLAALLLSTGLGARSGNSLSGSVVISSEELCRYSSADIRSVLTGAVAGLDVNENYGGPGISVLEHTGQYGASPKVSTTFRGSSLVWYLDGIPIQIGETPLDIEQIESITVVKDALDKASLGSTAAAGAIYIKTKHGSQQKGHKVFATAEYGMNVVDRLPVFADGGQYARINNYARANSSLSPLYTREDVTSYAKADANSAFFPSVNWRKETLREAMPYRKVNFSTSGSDGAGTGYFVSLGYLGQDDIFKCSQPSAYDRIGINANIDAVINDWIDVSFGFLSSYTIRTSPNYGTETYSEDFTGLISDLVSLPPTAFPILLDGDSQIPSYAVGTSYTRNPVAALEGNGYYTETSRKGLMKIGLDMDLSFLTKGLESHTEGAFDVVNFVRIGKSEDYTAYILTPAQNLLGQMEMIPSLSSAHTYRSVSEKSKLLDYYSNRYYLSQTFRYGRTFGGHEVSALADFVLTQRNQKFISEHRRWIDCDLSAGDVIGGRLILKASVNLHGTYSLLRKWSLSPAIGIGWKATAGLKLRVQAASLSYDPLADANRDVDNYTWGNAGAVFGPYSSYQWFGSLKSTSAYRTYISRLASPNLRLERRHELQGGADLNAFEGRLDASLTGYLSFCEGTPTSMVNSIPAIVGNSSGSLFINCNSTLRYGGEMSVRWKQTRGDFSYSIGALAASNFSRITEWDEIRYPESYRSRIGRSASAIWGLRCCGKQENGLLSYVDMNADGKTDDVDMCVIGDSSPKLLYALNLFFRWKSLDLSLTGTGKAFYDILCNNAYFHNGWGTNNYSLYTMEHLYDPEAPIISYDKAADNYKTSSYWLAPGGFFKIQSLELGWNARKCARIYLRANNLLTLSGMKGTDPESIGAGITNYPLMKTFILGVKLDF